MTDRALLPPDHAILSEQMSDAASELANRIELGEFDDLDEGQLNDLHALSNVMERWAAMAHIMEERLFATPYAASLPVARRGVAIRN